MRLALYWRTVRHLRMRQIVGRAISILPGAAPDLASPPPSRTPCGPWREPARRPPSLTGPGQFRFLNEDGQLDQIGWEGAARSKLWRYNQHYFDDLNARDAHVRGSWHRTLIENWLARNPPGHGAGWEAYPTSLRIVNWIKSALGGAELGSHALHSLAIQARWLSTRIEWRLLGNHVFANAKALTFAGLFFEGEAAKRWRIQGLRILASQAREQILSDGGHFELSPMYHALALEDVLDLVNLARRYDATLDDAERDALRALEARVPAMRAWLGAMSHPDGRISFFNDAAFAIAPDNDELDAYALRLDFGPSQPPARLVHLRDSGYARLANGPAVAIVDMARVGPDYLPGHAHADTLSFELSVFGHRVIVNSGTSVYGDGAERLRQRETRAHSTVLVEDVSSSEVWSSFRVARRAYPVDVRVGGADCELFAEAAHDGYTRLPGKPIHKRRWTLGPGRLSIEDKVSAPQIRSEARFHLHPDMACELIGPSRCELATSEGRPIHVVADGVELRVERSTFHPEFGMAAPSDCIVAPLRDGRSRVDLIWS